MRVIGFDIGGANIKAATSDGKALSRSFPLWKHPELLSHQLVKIKQQFTAENFDAFAITMTGELADCYPDRTNGVQQIVSAVVAALGDRCYFYAISNRWLSAPDVMGNELHIASANWHLLASYLRLQICKPTLLIDVGSTTTDIILLDAKKVLSKSITDQDRLISGELVYTGIERSNVAGIVQQIQFEGSDIPVINEQFATTKDINIILGFLPPNADDTDTADGRSSSLINCQARIARIIGTDSKQLTDFQIRQLAEKIFDKQVALVTDKVYEVIQTLTPSSRSVISPIVSGHGDFLAKAAIQRVLVDAEAIQLSKLLGPTTARCAAAFAAAQLFTNAVHARNIINVLRD